MLVIAALIFAILFVPLDAWAAAFRAIGWILSAPFRGMAWLMLRAFFPEALERDRNDRPRF